MRDKGATFIDLVEIANRRLADAQSARRAAAAWKRCAKIYRADFLGLADSHHSQALHIERLVARAEAAEAKLAAVREVRRRYGSLAITHRHLAGWLYELDAILDAPPDDE